MGPRLRAGEQEVEPLVTGLATPPDSMKKKDTSGDVGPQGRSIDVKKLNIQVRWDGDSCTTCLCYGDSMLIQGCVLKATWDAGFAQSFQWFCEEAAFLYQQFRTSKNPR